MINDILDLAKSDAGQLVVSIEPLDPIAVVRDSVMLVSSMAEKQRINIHFNQPRETPRPVLGDYTRLKQSILNLLTNAIKYNVPEGRVEISIEHQADGSTRFRVVDTGLGIPVDQQSTLFEPFVRGNEQYQTIDGVGIGLNITRRLVGLMGGTIGFTTETNRGSEFWIDLPTDPVERVARPDVAVMEAGSPPSDPAGVEATKVLYVEDNPANQALMQDIVDRLADTEFILAETGQAGLDMARTLKPDVILLDISLPDMNGFEVLRNLRRDFATKDIPVVAVTANAMPKDIELGREAGFTDYLTKPVKLDQIHDAIRVHGGS